MPLYGCQCNECGNTKDIFRRIDDRDKDLPVCCGNEMSRVVTPLYVIEDTKPFLSPIDGKEISTRKALREHCQRHDVIQVGDEKLPEKKPYRPKKGDVAEDIKKSLAQHGV